MSHTVTLSHTIAKIAKVDSLTYEEGKAGQYSAASRTNAIRATIGALLTTPEGLALVTLASEGNGNACRQIVEATSLTHYRGGAMSTIGEFYAQYPNGYSDAHGGQGSRCNVVYCAVSALARMAKEADKASKVEAKEVAQSAPVVPVVESDTVVDMAPVEKAKKTKASKRKGMSDKSVDANEGQA